MGLSDSLMVEGLHCSEDPAGHLMPLGPEADITTIMAVFTVEHGRGLLSPECQMVTVPPFRVGT